MLRSSGSLFRITSVRIFRTYSLFRSNPYLDWAKDLESKNKLTREVLDWIVKGMWASEKNPQIRQMREALTIAYKIEP